MKKFVAMMVLMMLVVQSAFACELPGWAKATSQSEVLGEVYGFDRDVIVLKQNITYCSGTDQITDYFTVIYQDHEEYWLIVNEGIHGLGTPHETRIKIGNNDKEYLEAMLFKYRKGAGY